jgi:nucleoside-diphosphate-sugar epimerase
MKAFVTGASGFIGTHLVRHLVQNDWKVSILRHKKDGEGLEECQVFQGDIKDPLSLRGLFKRIDVLFHLAAALGASRIDKKEFYAINVQGTENVLKAAAEAGVGKVIHFSSAGVLGSVKENRPVEETHKPFPQDVYDRTKLEGERTALRFAAQGGNITVIRPGWVYGPGDRRTFKLIRAVAAKKFLLVTKGNTRQTPVYIDDLVQGILLCTKKAPPGEIFHLAGGENLTVKEITQAIAQAANVPLAQFSLPLFALKAAAWKWEKAYALLGKEAPLTRGKLAFFIHPKPLSIQKAVNDLGYAPQWDFKTGIEAAVRWYRKNGWLPSLPSK